MQHGSVTPGTKTLPRPLKIPTVMTTTLAEVGSLCSLKTQIVLDRLT